MLEKAVRSAQNAGLSVLLVSNGAGSLAQTQTSPVVLLPQNIGIPAGRDAGLLAANHPFVVFLDDDAVVETKDLTDTVTKLFDDDPSLAVISFRLVDEQGATSGRHVPRMGKGRPLEPGDVTHFLGGACAIRRSAYLEVGGYEKTFWYGHEELDLAWRLIDAGYRIHYLPSVEVFHPRTEMSRHRRAWELTGRNRVWVARRNLPLLVLSLHVCIWLILGIAKAPKGSRKAYVAGWISGWQGSIDRHPMRWGTVWKLTRLGRPPII